MKERGGERTRQGHGQRKKTDSLAKLRIGHKDTEITDRQSETQIQRQTGDPRKQRYTGKPINETKICERNRINNGINLCA